MVSNITGKLLGNLWKCRFLYYTIPYPTNNSPMSVKLLLKIGNLPETENNGINSNLLWPEAEKVEPTRQ